MPVTWVKPQLVCEIKFTEWTKDWIARHPIFMGLRKDKSPKDVHIEKSTNITLQKEAAAAETDVKKTAKNKAAGAKASKVTTAKQVKDDKRTLGKLAKTTGMQLDLSNGTEQVVKVGKQELKLTNLDKLYWKKEKCRKIDMLNYYFSVAPYMLPYMQDRPQSMHRHPNGIDGASFYQKDTKGKIPDWIQTHKSYSESNDEYIDYLVCRDEATLIYMANAGCIEMHPWHSRVASPENPDWCLIDLDPEGIGFDKVIECAQVVKKVLDALGIEAFPKTSGSTGIHIYIPLGAKYSYEQSKQLAEVVVTLVHQEIPSFTSLERSPSKRKNKIYLDYLQNRNTQTAASPYSLRPKPGVPVSTPLYWEEIKKGLTPTTYNMNNIFDRLKVEGDIFRGVLGKGIDMDKVLKKIENL
jgi:bifunctional non-homologous end joining protein LigD